MHYQDCNISGHMITGQLVNKKKAIGLTARTVRPIAFHLAKKFLCELFVNLLDVAELIQVHGFI